MSETPQQRRLALAQHEPRFRARDGLIVLNCVHCRSDLVVDRNDALECNACGVLYPRLGDVPVMFSDVFLSPGRKPSADVARQIAGAFGLPDDPIGVERVRALFTQQAIFGDALISTEATQFLDRVRTTGHTIAETGPSADVTDSWEGQDLDAGIRNADAVGRPEWLIDYVPRKMRLGETILANVRFRNVGEGIMPCEGMHPVAVSARWQDEHGAPLAVLDHRTPLPVDLLPGRSLTLPVRIQAPDQPGHHRLSLVFVQEDVQWFEEEALLLRVQVSEEAQADCPPGWWIRDEAPKSYNADHERGVTLLRQWVEAFAPSFPKILEVGGNAVPMIEQLDGELYNVDVDLLGLQVCAMRQKQAKRAMTIVCADAGKLPFPVGSFDVIAIFASLHHFPDPVAVLTQLRGRLRPGGFLAVMCEPVGHMWPGAVLPEYLRELKRGANEQSFTPEEYARMFRVAEFETLEAIVDRDSLKARLKPVSGS